MDDLGATAAHDGNGRDPPHDDVVAESTTIVPLAAKDVPEKTGVLWQALEPNANRRSAGRPSNYICTMMCTHRHEHPPKRMVSTKTFVVHSEFCLNGHEA